MPFEWKSRWRLTQSPSLYPSTVQDLGTPASPWVFDVVQESAEILLPLVGLGVPTSSREAPEHQLADLADIVVVHTVGYRSALPADEKCCGPDRCALDFYSDGSPVYSLVRDFSAGLPTPPEYLTGGIWHLPAGTEVVIEDPRRTAGYPAPRSA